MAGTRWWMLAGALLLALGTAGEASAQEKRLRIATFGTSLTAIGGWQEPLARAIEACTGEGVDVSNDGRAGASSNWGVEAVEAAAARKPDIAFIEFAVNDAALDRLTSIVASTENMRAIIAAFRARNPAVRIYVMSMNPLTGYRLWVRPLRDRYEDAHSQLAAELGLGYIDHRPDWVRMGADALYLAITDGAHPTAGAASAIVVLNILKHLEADGLLRCRDDSGE